MTELEFRDSDHMREFMKEVDCINDVTRFSNDKSVELRMLKAMQGIILVDWLRLRVVILDYRTEFDICNGWRILFGTVAAPVPKWDGNWDHLAQWSM